MKLFACFLLGLDPGGPEPTFSHSLKSRTFRIVSGRREPRLIRHFQNGISFALGVIAVLEMLTGCDRLSSQIVGKWTVNGDPKAMVWEFSSNGRVVTGETPGKYNLGDGKRIKIQTPSATFVYHLELSDDRMTLQDASGTKIEFTRAK